MMIEETGLFKSGARFLGFVPKPEIFGPRVRFLISKNKFVKLNIFECHFCCDVGLYTYIHTYILHVYIIKIVLRLCISYILLLLSCIYVYSRTISQTNHYRTANHKLP